MTDPYTSFIDNPIASARAPYAVVPHDSDALPVVPKALYIGTGGTVTLRGVDGTADVSFLNVADGQPDIGGHRGPCRKGEGDQSAGADMVDDDGPLHQRVQYSDRAIRQRRE